MRVAHRHELHGEIHGARLAFLQRDLRGQRAFRRLRGGVEDERNFRRTAAARFVAHHGAGDDFVTHVCDLSERREEHQRLPDRDRRFARAEAVIARMHHRHEAVARERIGRGEARFHAPFAVGAQRGKPARRAGKIVAQFWPRPFGTAAADEVALVGKREVGRIFGQQIVERDAGADRELNQLLESRAGLRARVAGEREDAVVRGEKRDLRIGHRHAVRVEHAHFRFDFLAGPHVEARGRHGDLEVRHRIGHAQRADAVAKVRGLEFPRALLRPAQQHH